METDSLGVAPQRSPRRLFGKKLRRWGTFGAAIITAAVVAGCGTASSSGSSTGSQTTPTSTSADAFNPNLVPASGSSPGASSKAKSQATKKTAQSKSSLKKPSRPSSSKSSLFTPSTPKPAPTPTPTPSPSPTPAPSGGSGSGGTQTVTVSHTSTVTVTKYIHVSPKVPAGAGLPSAHRAASVSRFDAARGNIGCRIQGGTARCDIAHRVWAPPHKPSSCHAAWAQGLMIPSSGPTLFVCGRSSVLDPTGYYIRPGYDDKVGSVTCQVRSFGVTCFQADGHGFFVGRTGYTTF